MTPPRAKSTKFNFIAYFCFEALHWLATNKLRNIIGVVKYKRIVKDVIFLKYISYNFKDLYAKLVVYQRDYIISNASSCKILDFGPQELRVLAVQYSTERKYSTHPRAALRTPL